ncbi:Hypothetical predicted protein [Mytilus galloprovincialis]|uniref:Tyr recombinase domain-containing protein n=1 Tax=Mytilus galloprovincialis TaxID=29158 RepID=A0A8B6DAR4_MYTGA|nr:Hypothetical predicted protein [Mytilus galloprovincialis]
MSQPYTTFLFGDDVSKVVKDIEDCSKIANRIHLTWSQGLEDGLVEVIEADLAVEEVEDVVLVEMFMKAIHVKILPVPVMTLEQITIPEEGDQEVSEKSGLGYSSLNTARGSLSALGLKCEGHLVGSHPLIIRTKQLRQKNSKLLISYVKPHQDITKETTWIKTVLQRSGIDTKIYGAHRVRSATTSRAKLKAVPIQEILDKAGWTNERTFSKFYNKKVLTEDVFVSAVLQ